eukprot:scaffold2687_cov133-Chaetoceros_neogracile.AAC.3
MSENGTEEKLTRSEWAKREIDLIQSQCTFDCSETIMEIEDLDAAAAAAAGVEAEAAAEVEVDPDNGNRKRDLDRKRRCDEQVDAPSIPITVQAEFQAKRKDILTRQFLVVIKKEMNAVFTLAKKKKGMNEDPKEEEGMKALQSQVDRYIHQEQFNNAKKSYKVLKGVIRKNE